jgi:serine O-acetyltransferase
VAFFRTIREDIQSVFDRDPAARSMVEVLLCYPGLHAVWMHRVNHWMWCHGLHTLARFCSQAARFMTGIEIHPGATIGRRLFIDHGMGVVIGETAEVADDVTIYQAVTLGGTTLNKGKRHPTIENGVVIGGGAKVLGNIRVGENSRIGAGSVVLRDVPDNSTIVGVPGHIIFRNGKRVVITDPKEIQDPLSEVVINLARELQDLKRQLAEHQHAIAESGLAEYTETAEASDAAMAALSARQSEGQNKS